MPEVSLLGLLPLQSGANNSQSHLQNVSQVHLPHALSTPSSCLLTLSGTPDSHFDTCPLWSITSSPPSSQRSSWSNHFSRSKDLLVSHLLARPSLSLSSSRMLGCLWFSNIQSSPDSEPLYTLFRLLTLGPGSTNL